MKHAKFVSFTEVGARTAAKAAALLPDFLIERAPRFRALRSRRWWTAT